MPCVRGTSLGISSVLAVLGFCKGDEQVLVAVGVRQPYSLPAVSAMFSKDSIIFIIPTMYNRIVIYLASRAKSISGDGSIAKSTAYSTARTAQQKQRLDSMSLSARTMHATSIDANQLRSRPAGPSVCCPLRLALPWRPWPSPPWSFVSRGRLASNSVRLDEFQYHRMKSFPPIRCRRLCYPDSQDALHHAQAFPMLLLLLQGFQERGHSPVLCTRQNSTGRFPFQHTLG
jgi:hypothetical protein